MENDEMLKKMHDEEKAGGPPPRIQAHSLRTQLAMGGAFLGGFALFGGILLLALTTGTDGKPNLADKYGIPTGTLGASILGVSLALVIFSSVILYLDRKGRK